MMRRFLRPRRFKGVVMDIGKYESGEWMKRAEEEEEEEGMMKTAMG